MSTIKKLLAIFSVSLCAFLGLAFSAKADTFNPNYIISDNEALDYFSMTLDEVKEFLGRKGGFLASYSTTDPDGKIMTAAEIIYDRSITNKINPKFIIVLLQKEQSLIEDKDPKQSQLDWAAGYGCPDGASCNPRWQGFWKQVNSASLQFRDYLDNPHLYTYKAGETYTFNNPYAANGEASTLVTPINQATAALYNYTPHVYNGNYNFYNIWQRYFTRAYADGSLLQAKNEAGVWLIQDGKKRPFLSKGALTSRFDPKKIIIVNQSDLDKYPAGAAIKFAQYSLIRSPRGTVFLLVDDQRRGFASKEALRKMGFNPEEIAEASWDDINSYQEALPLTATSTYPTGALLQDKKTGGVYWVMAGEKAPVWDPIFLKTKFKNKKIIPVKQEELNNYQTVEPVKFADGELLKAAGEPGVYLIAGGQKRPFSSGEIFESLGYKWENIIAVSAKILNLYPLGESVSVTPAEAEEENSI